jgi:uncharacterized protein (TIGR02145 family)
MKSKLKNEVKIGLQIWMSENLDSDKFCNGDIIPFANSSDEWEKAGENKQPCWCYYNEVPNYLTYENIKIYGKLYNWFAVNDARGLAPIGWRIPSDMDWNQLNEYLGEDAGLKLKSKDYWYIEGNNKSGFNALPAGYCDDSLICYDINHWGCWWSSTEESESNAIAYSLSNDFDEFGSMDDDKKYGLSVRCIKV